MTTETLQRYRTSSDRGLKWLAAHLREDGSYGETEDLAGYYKSPYLFLQSGREEEAHRILDFIARRFMQEDGDFVTSPGIKSANGALQEYWGYTNGWIAIAARALERLDVSQGSYRYLKTFRHPKLGGFTTNGPYEKGSQVVDVLTTSHLGLVALNFGDVDIAERAAVLLQTFVEAQPQIDTSFLLRMDGTGNLTTTFLEDAAAFFTVQTGHPHQAYFMIGYPIGFLGKLHRATRKPRYLETAKRYLDFALACHEGIRAFHFSHKVAWGAALLANLTGDVGAARLSREIAGHLVDIQDPEGAWLQNEPVHDSFDQTAEITLWLREIAKELAEQA